MITGPPPKIYEVRDILCPFPRGLTGNGGQNLADCA
jgi:hypothetical protein